MGSEIGGLWVVMGSGEPFSLSLSSFFFLFDGLIACCQRIFLYFLVLPY